MAEDTYSENYSITISVLLYLPGWRYYIQYGRLWHTISNQYLALLCRWSVHQTAIQEHRHAGHRLGGSSLHWPPHQVEVRTGCLNPQAPSEASLHYIHHFHHDIWSICKLIHLCIL